MIASACEARYPQKRYAYKQISLFTRRIRSAYLVAWDSPRKAFYRIWIEATDGEYSIVKESGIRGRVLDRRQWPAENLDDAQMQFQRRVKAKTNPERKSPRKYTFVRSS